MKKEFFCLLFFIPFFANAQNLPQCDSLIITCCTFDTLGANTLTIYADNPSSELFDYPGFILFDAAMDTIAKETVVYFGIGTGPEPHIMTIVSPLSLPFTGYLNLYTIFYQSLACSFPFTIADTATAITDPILNDEVIVFPNPCFEELHIELAGSSANCEVMLSILDVTGKEIYAPIKEQLPAVLPLNGIKAGLYLLRVANTKNHVIQFQKVVVQHQ
jgi:type IX secretion system substrate protein